MKLLNMSDDTAKLLASMKEIVCFFSLTLFPLRGHRVGYFVMFLLVFICLSVWLLAK